MSNAFAPIVRARPNPIFGRPVHQGSPPIDYSPILLLKPFGFRIAPDTLSSDENLVGQRGITPAFGYSAPHPSTGGTLTLVIHALPSAHYAPVRLLRSVHRRLQPLRPSRRGPVRRQAARPNRRSPRFRRGPLQRDVVFDPGRASAPRMAVPHILPSTLLTVSASASFEISWLNSTPHCIAVYASQPPSPTTMQHSLPGARYGLPAPVFHRLDRASFPGAQATSTKTATMSGPALITGAKTLRSTG